MSALSPALLPPVLVIEYKKKQKALSFNLQGSGGEGVGSTRL